MSLFDPTPKFKDMTAAYQDVMDADDERLAKILRHFERIDALYHHASKLTQDPRKLLAIALLGKMEAQERCIDLLRNQPLPPIVIRTPEGVAAPLRQEGDE